jgi:hypothetical protein
MTTPVKISLSCSVLPFPSINENATFHGLLSLVELYLPPISLAETYFLSPIGRMSELVDFFAGVHGGNRLCEVHKADDESGDDPLQQERAHHPQELLPLPSLPDRGSQVLKKTLFPCVSTVKIRG